MYEVITRVLDSKYKAIKANEDVSLIEIVYDHNDKFSYHDIYHLYNNVFRMLDVFPEMQDSENKAELLSILNLKERKYQNTKIYSEARTESGWMELKKVGFKEFNG